VTIIPAIDLLGGKAVRLHQGRYDAVTVYDDDPPARARTWRGKVPWLHVVDLEGAREGRPVQREGVRAVVDAFGPGVEVGGGVRTRESFEAYLELGAARVVLGSAAVNDAALVRTLALEHPGVVIVAVDARDGFVAVDGWTKPTRVRAVDLVRSFADAPLAGVLYTDVTRDGTGAGPNLVATAELAAQTPVPVIASGGVGSLDDLRGLASHGVSACIVGRALYDGAFTTKRSQRRAKPASTMLEHGERTQGGKEARSSILYGTKSSPLTLLVSWPPCDLLSYGFGAAASTLARLRRRRAASACFLRRLTLGFM
jgi:phosphoribosylformimino-5-aminoimidazole carboxamide ribotide isomerase